jgi:hypothetical protein
MNKLQNLFKGKPNKEEEISKVVPLSDCSHDCVSCTTKFPSSVKFDDGEGDIYNSAKPTACHLIVPTGKADWPHDATSVPKTVENAVADWISESSKGAFPDGNVKCSTSSLPVDLLDAKCSDRESGDVLILPFFIWLRKVDAARVRDVLTELMPLLIKARDEGSEPPSEVHGYKIEKSLAHSYVLLCSHTTRDKRCGITAPLMKREMDHRLRETGHYRDAGDESKGGVHVTFVNHVGGHKFGANVIIYLRTGEIIWLAKCSPKNAQPIIDETVLGGGKVWSDLVRVVNKEKAIEW